MFTLNFSTDNAAFEHDERREIGLLLKRLGDTIATTSETDGPIYDINGNRIGDWQWSPQEE